MGPRHRMHERTDSSAARTERGQQPRATRTMEVSGEAVKSRSLYIQESRSRMGGDESLMWGVGGGE